MKKKPDIGGPIVGESIVDSKGNPLSDANPKDWTKISPVTHEFNNEGLNSLRDKINEIIQANGK